MRTNKPADTTRKTKVRDAAIQINGEAKTDLFQRVTNKIIEVIEAGEANGCISWAGQGAAAGLPRNLKTGNAYQGINVLLLWGEAQAKGYTSPYWLTYKQAQELGGNVKKGEKSVECVFWGNFVAKEEGEDGETEERALKFAKSFYLFNVAQCEGLQAPDAAPVAVAAWDAHEAAERIIKATGASIIEGGAKAYYRPSTDTVHMPDRPRFEQASDYYAVMLHELTHWTSHSERCNRELKGRFGDQAYAAEELIAELGAAFLCAETCVEGTVPGHAGYIKSWLRVLKNDKRAIITAASQAGRAARWLLDAAANTAQKAAA